MLRLSLRSDISPCRARMVSRSVGAFFREFLKDEVCHDLELALCEMFSNAALHAYFGKSGPLDFEAAVYYGNKIDFRISDEGDEFVCPVGLPCGTSGSGRGIFMVRRIMDEFSYERGERTNIFYLTKYISREQWKECT